MDISNNIEPFVFSLTGLSKINVLVGKNGTGKSTLLKKIDEALIGENIGVKNYVPPERGGSLMYDSGVEQNSRNNEDWATQSKRRNQWESFKPYTVNQFRKLEMAVLREMESDHVLRQDLTYSFNTVIKKINDLLDNVSIIRAVNGDFDIVLKNTDTKIPPYRISSGESELISLAIECLTFEKTCEAGKQNFLLLDEPDVHLHPDLQANFILFLIELVSSNKFDVIIATHSTAILGALFNYEHSRFAILSNGTSTASFEPISKKYQSILPIFGAHPLSNLFNQSPIFLVEGEDDVRIIQQAIRTSHGALKLYPCSVDGVGNMPEFEDSVIQIINGVYDNAKAYSLRDRDDGDENINDTIPLVKCKTSCRAAENLILTDEVLNALGTSWEELEVEIEKWLVAFPGHTKFNQMNEFKGSGYNRKDFDLKEIRNVLIGLTNSNKPWEIAVGQSIGYLVLETIPKDFSNHKLCNYMGQKFTDIIKE